MNFNKSPYSYESKVRQIDIGKAQDFYARFPTAELLPSAYSVAKLEVPDARHCLVHIRQLHDSHEVDENELHIIQGVQDDVYSILRSENIRIMPSDKIYTEGAALEQDVMQIESCDSTEDIVMKYALHIECIAEVDRLTFAYLESRFRDQYGKNAPDVIRNAILDVRKILFEHEELYFKRWLSISELRQKVISRANQVLRKYFGNETTNPGKHFLGSVFAITQSIRHMGTHRTDEYTDESFAIVNQLHEFALEEKALRIQQLKRAIASRASRINYAVDRIYQDSQSTFNICGTESPLINILCQDTNLDRDLILDARERIILELMSLRQQYAAFVIFGGAHDFVGQIQSWNQERPDDKFCLIEVTPRKYAEYVDGDDPTTQENLTILQSVVFPYPILRKISRLTKSF